MANKIFSKIAKLFKRNKDPQSVGFFVVNKATDLIVPWYRSNERKIIEEDIDKMDKEDSLVGVALDKIADFAACWSDEDEIGFKVVAEADPSKKRLFKTTQDAVDYLNEVSYKIGVNDMSCWDLMRTLVKKGNVFSENIIGDDYRIAKVAVFPRSWQIVKNVDKSGNLLTGDPVEAGNDSKKMFQCPYVQIDESGKPIVAFYAFQIVHWMFGATEGEVYAEPLLAREIRDWKRLRSQEDALGIARITRAWDVRVHKILVPAGATKDEVEEKIRQYKEAIEGNSFLSYDSSNNLIASRNYSPMSVQKDFYVPCYYTADGRVIEGGIEGLNPSTAMFDSVNDIHWGATRLLVALCIPMDYIGLKVGQRAFVDKTSEKGLEAFSRFVKRLQRAHAYGLKQIFDLELLLSGFNPTEIKYSIKYPQIVPESAEIASRVLFDKTRAAEIWLSLGLPVELIGKAVLGLNPDEVEMWRQNIKSNIDNTKNNGSNNDEE